MNWKIQVLDSQINCGSMLGKVWGWREFLYLKKGVFFISSWTLWFSQSIVNIFFFYHLQRHELDKLNFFSSQFMNLIESIKKLNFDLKNLRLRFETLKMKNDENHFNCIFFHKMAMSSKFSNKHSSISIRHSLQYSSSRK